MDDMKTSNSKLVKLAAAVGCGLAVTATALAVPVPRPVLRDRIKAGDTEIYGIVHWGLNTYTDREWGYGDENPQMLAPARFDADQIVRACADGGLRGLVVVAKHHDGFCLWPTKTTEHNISKSPFRNGKGDYVKEMSDACRKAGIRFGVYCSPWDRNSSHYGTKKYVELYHAQIKELLDGRYGDVFEMWFDGANGGDGFYGGARESRKIPDGYYDFDTIFGFVRRLQPNVCIFTELRDDADFRWPCNERGTLDPDSRATIRPFDSEYLSYGNVGDIDGSVFHPCEADFPLRPGWFCHESQNGDVKSGEYLMKLYLSSVGNAGTMNIGIAPSRDGVLHAGDVAVLRRFREIREAFFARPVSGEGKYNVIVMKEDITKGERVARWVAKAGNAELGGKSIGSKRIRVLDEAQEFSTGFKVDAFDLDGKSVEVETALYYADPELVKSVLAAKDPAEEVDQHGAGALTSSNDRSLVYRFEDVKTFDRLRFVPDPEHVGGAPVEFSLAWSLDGRAWKDLSQTYRLDNVAANPVAQTLKLETGVTAREIRLTAKRTLKEGEKVALLGLAIAR